MRCPKCNEYVPEGLGIKNCPSCHGELSNPTNTSEPVVVPIPKTAATLPNKLSPQEKSPGKAGVALWRFLVKSFFICFWIACGLFCLFVFFKWFQQAIRPQTGIIQAISKDGKYSETFYGDNANAWNAKVDIDFGDEPWVLISKKKGDYREMKQYMKKGETAANWTEVLNVDRLVGPFAAKMTPDKVAQGFRSVARMEKTDVEVHEHDVYATGLSPKDNRYDFARVMLDGDVVFTVTYTNRQPGNEKRINDWKEKIKKLQIVRQDKSV